jgi:hypothetical protein
MSRPSPIIIQSVGAENSAPYFFQNDNIDHNVYIVQLSNSIDNALYIIDVWNRERYNCGRIDRTITLDDMPYNMYRYINNQTIELELINGGDDRVKVLVVQFEGKMYVYALLRYS